MNYETKLQLAVREWVGAALITEEQGHAILAFPSPKTDTHHRFVAIVSMIGALLFAVGIGLVIKAHWEVLGDWVKISSLLVLLVGAYTGGWMAKIAPGKYPKTGEGLLMAGTLLFMAGIALVSQVFHLNDRPATGVFIWWIGILGIPWATRARGAQYVSLVAAFTWIGMEMTTADSWFSVAVPGAYVRNDWITVQCVYLLLGGALWLAGLAQRGGRANDFAGLHEKCGLLITGASLYILGFARHDLRWEAQRLQTHSNPAVFLAMALLAIAGLCAWKRSRRECLALGPWLVLACVPVVGFLVLRTAGGDGWPWSAAAWVGLFLLALATTRVGLQTGREGWVNIGLGLIALDIFTSYFDLFGTMLEGGMFFIVTGVVVLTTGVYLEKKRRVLVANLRKEIVA